MEPAPILWLTFSLVLTLLWEAGCILLIILWFLAAELITLLATISLALSVHVGQVGAAAVPLAWWLVAETASQLWGIAASAAGGISALPPVARDVATVSIAMSGALAVGWVVQHFMDCEQQQALPDMCHASRGEAPPGRRLGAVPMLRDDSVPPLLQGWPPPPLVLRNVDLEEVDKKAHIMERMATFGHQIRCARRTCTY
ncbi:unnamed protein product [Vitrella brassicaformis CCMP3155]|uniref:Uncharacterized protein n=1 Tax=Vitrella brassicaformis (strain CCMP3155) TaxID=1169540 RepID=A0A0G4F4Z5_VITBC|nr:unnamed protein product [Vitrella brassicaformis CCMP3155]|eukprot:CEM07541.1 unnamed protein product [Vitrella brassicaformis CCMP3155]